MDLSPGYVNQGDPLRAFDDNGWVVVGGPKTDEDMQRFDTATEDGLPPWDVTGAEAGSVNGSGIPSSAYPAISPHLDFDEFLSRQTGFLAHKESRCAEST